MVQNSVKNTEGSSVLYLKLDQMIKNAKDLGDDLKEIDRLKKIIETELIKQKINKETHNGR